MLQRGEWRLGVLRRDGGSCLKGNTQEGEAGKVYHADKKYGRKNNTRGKYYFS